MNEFTEKTADTFFKLRYLDNYMSGHKGFIAGGVFKNIFENKPFKDIDIFFENEKDYKDAFDKFSKDKDYSKLYDNKSASCFQKNNSKVKVDLVKSTYGNHNEIISKFDFTITKFSYFKKENEEGGLNYMCSFHNDFFEHLSCKKLVIDDKVPFPVGTFERSYRYKSYGYGLCRESKAKLIQALQGAKTENLSKDLYFGWD